MTVTLRQSSPTDLAVLERLAQLDSRALPPGPHLVAERGGRIDAALSLSTGELVADPFRRTAELCELLRCHATQVCEGGEPAVAPTLGPRAEPVTA